MCTCFMTGSHQVTEVTRWVKYQNYRHLWTLTASLTYYDNYNGFDNFARANYEVKIRISNGSHERNKKSTSLFKQNDENVIY